MSALTLAHLSDLHLGDGHLRTQVAARLIAELHDSNVDHVVVTGDLTHSGRIDDHALATALLAPLAKQGRLTVIPGNHDRENDEIADLITKGRRVWVERKPGLHLICVDSTAPHNRVSYRSHGDLCEQTLAQIDHALDGAKPGDACVVLLHHHLVKLPTEGIGEWFADQFGWPHASELTLGHRLLEMATGRADLILHGHRHVPRRITAAEGDRPLQVCNAGSSTELGAYRTFKLIEGRLRTQPEWSKRREQADEVLPVRALTPSPIAA